MNKIIVITGPTGVGKTKLSIELAGIYNGEIINADSMQIYKGLDIGTAKVRDDEMNNIPHHLLSIKDVSNNYSVYDYQIDGRRVIEDIFNRGKVPIIVGGTGLYIKALLYDYDLSMEEDNNQYEEYSTSDLYDMLINMDKDSIDNIDKNNRRRIIRAINYYKNNGISITKNKTDKLLYDAIFIGLTTDRDNLYKIINNRVDIMINDGLVEEVKSFYDRGISTKPLTGGIGYKELYKYFDGKCSLEEAIDEIKKNSRHYAKRQYTFFNNQLLIKWFNTDYDNFNNTIDEVCNYIDSNV